MEKKEILELIKKNSNIKTSKIEAYSLFFRNVDIEFEKNDIILLFSNSFEAEAAKKSFFSEISFLFSRENSLLNKNLVFSTKSKIKNNKPIIKNTNVPFSDSIFSSKKEYDVDKSLNFENFFVSSDNKFTVETAKGISLSPGNKKINPFFVYGKSGVGKTHLLHAIGNNAIEKIPNINLKYVTTEKLTNLLISSLRSLSSSSVETIVNEYKNYDLLIIDDVQLFEGKLRTREIFFHILNEFIDKNKQIVFSSDVPPKELKGFEERFITRFQSGIISSLHPPDRDTLIQIIKKYITDDEGLRKNDIDDSVVTYLASMYNSNVRELHGALNIISSYAKIMQTETIDYKNVKSILKDNSPNKTGVTIEKIKSIVAKKYGITTENLESKSRKANFVRPRHVAIYLSRQLMHDFSLKEIGKSFGNRDHTTALSAFQKIDFATQNNPILKEEIEKIKEEIENSIK